MDVDDVIEEQWLPVPDVSLEHRHVDPGLTYFVIRVADVSEILDTGFLEIGEVSAVMHDAHGVGFREPNAEAVPKRIVRRVGRWVGPDAHMPNLVGTLGDDGRVTPAVRYLDERAIAYRLCEYHHATGRTDFGLEAAESLGIEPDRVLKTLVVLADGTEACAVVPVSARLSLRALAVALGSRRAEMCPPDRAERVTGYVVGGISPIAQKRSLPVLVDETAQVFDEVLVSGGRRGLDIALAPDDLIRATSGRFADIAQF